jgi:rod shape-determining protein MreC
VLLITDVNHAVPVQVNRNGVRSIAGGTGDPVYLELENVPITVDIVAGDLLETSGLGGGFPGGYPVGRVEAVRIEPSSAFAQVRLRPLAQLDRSRHLLVVLDVPDQPPADPTEADPEAPNDADRVLAVPQ